MTKQNAFVGFVILEKVGRENPSFVEKRLCTFSFFDSYLT